MLFLLLFSLILESEDKGRTGTGVPRNPLSGNVFASDSSSELGGLRQLEDIQLKSQTNQLEWWFDTELVHAYNAETNSYSPITFDRFFSFCV